VVLALVLTSRRLRHDRALLAVGSLVLAGLAVSQLWRVHVPFEYRRVVYFLGVGLAILFGAAFARRKPNAIWIAAFVLVLLYVGRTSVGLRLPERVFRSEPRAPAVSGLVAFRDELDRGALPDSRLLVSDACLHFAVPYLVRRPTLPAFSERQVGFVDRLPLARKAATILAGGPQGAALAQRLGVRYAVADPDCAPDLAARLHGTTVIRNEDLVVVRLPDPACTSVGGRIGSACPIVPDREGAQAGDETVREPLVPQAELEPGELAQLVGHRVRDPPAPAAPPEPAELLPRVP
jgi:hypothetical protein